MTLLHVGPGMAGRQPFDNHCIFGNIVWLTKADVLLLNQLVQDAPGVPLKYYICRMPKSSVDKKRGKMVRICPLKLAILLCNLTTCNLSNCCSISMLAGVWS